MALASFTKAEKELIVGKIRKYFADEFGQDLGTFEAGFLLNFIAEEIGPHFYNLGLRDAQAILGRRMDDIAGAIDEMTKPTGTRR